MANEPLVSDDAIFRYDPLPAADSIRLLFVDLAPDVNDLPRCELITIRLSEISSESYEGVEFTAVSYVWGNAAEHQVIFIGSKVMGIGQNLHDALRHIRRPDRPVLVWADGVCINQKDVAERSQQVSLMTAIFSTAKVTVAYLGNSKLSYTTHAAWNYLQRESENFKSLHPEKHQSLEDAIDFRGSLEDVENEVLSRAWFRRVWVLQEVVVSKRVVMLCGPRSVTWDDFCQAVLLKPRSHDRYGISISKRELYSYVRNLFLCRCAYQESIGRAEALPPWYKSIKADVESNPSALTVFTYARRLEATEVRDKIYALLGVSSRYSFANFPVNYVMDFESVCLSFAHYYMLTMASFDILSHVDTGGEIRSHSWVPHWNYPPSVSQTILSTLPPEDKQNQEIRKLHTQATKSWDPNAPWKLKCRGSIIGAVQWSSARIQITGQIEDEFERIKLRCGENEAVSNAKILRRWESLGYGTADLEEVTATGLRQTIIQSIRDDQDPTLWSHRTTYRRAERTEEVGQPSSWGRGWSLSNNASDPHDLPDFSELALFDGDVDEYDMALAKPFGELGILEQHIIKRSRTTVEWSSDDGSKAVAIVIDPTSTIDRRAFAKWVPIGEAICPPAVALVPSHTQEGDLLVSITGARIPFVVRELSEEDLKGDDQSENDLDEEGKAECADKHDHTTAECNGARNFVLIGECLINGYEDHDSLKKYAKGDDVFPGTIDFYFH